MRMSTGIRTAKVWYMEQERVLRIIEEYIIINKGKLHSDLFPTDRRFVSIAIAVRIVYATQLQCTENTKLQVSTRIVTWSQSHQENK